VFNSTISILLLLHGAASRGTDSVILFVKHRTPTGFLKILSPTTPGETRRYPHFVPAGQPTLQIQL